MSDSDVVGNKGSGAKLAVVPALRMGLNVSISSFDETGGYILSYTSQDVKLGNRTVKQIVFNYINDKESSRGSVGNEIFPSQLTLDAFMDWDKPIGDDTKKIFKALREYICNAWDEDKNFTIETVSEIAQAKPGTTSVYISITEEIQDILNFPSKYFKILGECPWLFSSEAAFGVPSGKIYPKSDPKTTRFFSQGVLVDCRSSYLYTSIFDYSLNDKYLLSEERIIKELPRFIEKIGRLITSIDNIELIGQIFRAMVMDDGKKARIELWALEGIEYIPAKTANLWKETWKTHFGPKAIIAVNSTQIDEDARNLGYEVMRNLPSRLVIFLKRCGVTIASDVAKGTSKKAEEKKPDYELFRLNEEQQDMFDEAYARFLRYYPEAKKLPVIFFRALADHLKNSGGHSGEGLRKYKEIWIAESSFVSVVYLLEVLLHEGNHCLKKAGDYDREFTQEGFKQMAMLIMANPIPSLKSSWRAKIIPRRGIIIPNKFIGMPVHILVNNQELRLKISTGKETKTLSINLPKEVEKQVSQNRIVTKFRNFGCVSLPDGVIRELPPEIILEIA